MGCLKKQPAPPKAKRQPHPKNKWKDERPNQNQTTPPPHLRPAARPAPAASIPAAPHTWKTAGAGCMPSPFGANLPAGRCCRRNPGCLFLRPAQAQRKASPAARAAWADGTPPNWKQPVASAAPPRGRQPARAVPARRGLPLRQRRHITEYRAGTCPIPPVRHAGIRLWPRLPLQNGMRFGEGVPKNTELARHYAALARKYLPDNPEADRLFPACCGNGWGYPS